MKRRKLFCLFGLSLLVLLQPATFGESEAETPFQPTLKNSIQAIIPLALHNTSMSDPRVLVRVQVSGDGKVQDLVVLRASHVGLAHRAERLIKVAEFETGDLPENEAIRFDVDLPFLYPSDLGLQGSTTLDDVELMLDGVKSEDLSLSYHESKELDVPLKILDRGNVYVPEDGSGQRIAGRAIVEFFVNHMGEVRLPRILSSDDPIVSKAAISSVSDMCFDPPRFEGKVAVTKVRMPFETQK